MDIILTREESERIEWAKKHEIPRMTFDPVLKVVGKLTDFMNYLNNLYENKMNPNRERDFPEQYLPIETRWSRGNVVLPFKVKDCTPLQAYLLEVNFGYQRL